MASPPTTQADRVARSLRRLGFGLTRVGRSFSIIDSTGELAANSETKMSLAEIERWIGEHIKPKRQGKSAEPPPLGMKQASSRRRKE